MGQVKQLICPAGVPQPGRKSTRCSKLGMGERETVVAALRQTQLLGPFSPQNKTVAVKVTGAPVTLPVVAAVSF